MNTFIVIMAILFFIINLFIALFLFAIWRGILGKSTIDFKLSTTMTAVGKKMETLSTSLDKHAIGNSDVSKQLKEVSRSLGSLADKLEN